MEAATEGWVKKMNCEHEWKTGSELDGLGYSNYKKCQQCGKKVYVEWEEAYPERYAEYLAQQGFDTEDQNLASLLFKIKEAWLEANEDERGQINNNIYSILSEVELARILNSFQSK